MPFVYRNRVASINRSTKRDDEFIHKRIIESLESISQSSGSVFIMILPTRTNDPPFNQADPNKFLGLYATKILGLTLYEVEYWLDVIVKDYPIPLDKCPRAYIDERRKYFRQASEGCFGNPKLMGGFISSHIIYSRKKD